MNEINHRAMTEAAIERAAEMAMDRLDRRLLMGTLSQHAYDEDVVKLNTWAVEQYRRARS